MAGIVKDKVAVVTGAGRGIGRAVALAMAEEGAKVVVNDLGSGPDGEEKSLGPADEVVAEIKAAGGMAIANYDTVATMEGGKNIIQTAIDNFGHLDILVNNAGILRDRMVFNMSEQEWDLVIKVHLYGHFFCTRNACSYFREQKSGRIINTSSRSFLGGMGQANYSSAKGGIVSLTRTVARDMGKYGVTCNAICPSARTRLTINPELEAAFKKKAESGVGPPLSAMELFETEPEDIAPFVVYLATDDAAEINGNVFGVSRGRVTLFSVPHEIKGIYKDGRWTLDELVKLVPKTLKAGLDNPAAPQKSN